MKTDLLIKRVARLLVFTMAIMPISDLRAAAADPKFTNAGNMGGGGVADPAIEFTAELNKFPDGDVITVDDLVSVADEVSMSQVQLINMVKNSQELTDLLKLTPGQTVESALSAVDGFDDLPVVDMATIQALYASDVTNIVNALATSNALTVNELSTLRDFVNAGGVLNADAVTDLTTVWSQLKVNGEVPEYLEDFAPFIDGL